jgi:hypothetical protein
MGRSGGRLVLLCILHTQDERDWMSKHPKRSDMRRFWWEGEDISYHCVIDTQYYSSIAFELDSSLALSHTHNHSL